MKKKLTVTLLAIFLPLSASAEVESWYTYWSLGLASADYPGPLNSDINAIDSLPGVDRTTTGIDMFGFYWPYQNNTMMGFVISGTGDRLQSSYSDYIQINQYIYGFSTMHFLGKEIGDGFFVRGDFGLAKANIDTSFAGSASSDTGTGFLLGVGYGLPVSGQSRILFGISLSHKTIESESYSTTTFSIGGLW